MIDIHCDASQCRLNDGLVLLMPVYCRNALVTHIAFILGKQGNNRNILSPSASAVAVKKNCVLALCYQQTFTTEGKYYSEFNILFDLSLYDCVSILATYRYFKKFWMSAFVAQAATRTQF